MWLFSRHEQSPSTELEHTWRVFGGEGGGGGGVMGGESVPIFGWGAKFPITLGQL